MDTVYIPYLVNRHDFSQNTVTSGVMSIYINKIVSRKILKVSKDDKIDNERLELFHKTQLKLTC